MAVRENTVCELRSLCSCGMQLDWLVNSYIKRAILGKPLVDDPCLCYPGQWTLTSDHAFSSGTSGRTDFFGVMSATGKGGLSAVLRSAAETERKNQKKKIMKPRQGKIFMQIQGPKPPKIGDVGTSLCLRSRQSNPRWMISMRPSGLVSNHRLISPTTTTTAK